jgi:hypothetical protein
LGQGQGRRIGADDGGWQGMLAQAQQNGVKEEAPSVKRFAHSGPVQTITLMKSKAKS